METIPASWGVAFEEVREPGPVLGSAAYPALAVPLGYCDGSFQNDLRRYMMSTMHLNLYSTELKMWLIDISLLGPSLW